MFREQGSVIEREQQLRDPIAIYQGESGQALIARADLERIGTDAIHIPVWLRTPEGKTVLLVTPLAGIFAWGDWDELPIVAETLAKAERGQKRE